VYLFVVSLLKPSWVEAVVFGLFLFSVTVWLATGALHRQRWQRRFKYLLIAVMVFTMIFSVSEYYVLRYADYPSTFDASQPGITIAYPNILNASMVEVLQGVKNTTAFNLLSVEYPGEVIIRCITLNTAWWDGGRIEVLFHHVPSNFRLAFNSMEGEPYRVDVFTWSYFTSFIIDPQKQTPEEGLQQIDNLGLQWFYDRTIEAYQNKTGAPPEITDLEAKAEMDIYIDVDAQVAYYQGITLQITGLSKNYSPYRFEIFSANFQPNGTLNYLNVNDSVL
jgi:hypothetical protein